MFVKICGTTNLPDAELAVELGADAVGFIFAPSKRRVTIEQVAAIAAHLPDSVERVGVFTDPNVVEIARTVHEAGLTAVQMHFPYDRQLVTDLRNALGADTKLWQVFGLPADTEAFEADRTANTYTLANILRDDRISVVLLDAIKGGASGGLGVAFSWTAAAGLLQAARTHAQGGPRDLPEQLPAIALAGGLNPENVHTAISALQPWGVDVVSGVEISPGRKGPDRLKAFLAAARPEFHAVRGRAGTR